MKKILRVYYQHSDTPQTINMINFSGISNKGIIGRMLRMPLRLLPVDAKIPVLQGKLRGKKWIIGSANHGCWLGTYEYEKQGMFVNRIKEGSVVYDIGANVGFYTLLASVLVGPRGKVIAFEPLPSNIYFLKEHVRLNKCSNVTVIDAAVSEKSGVTFFEEHTNRCMGSLSSKGSLEVKTICLDDFVAKGEFPPPHYMKIDVEGAELLVLTGAKSILTNYHPTIFLATHGIEVHR